MCVGVFVGVFVCFCVCLHVCLLVCVLSWICVCLFDGVYCVCGWLVSGVIVFVFGGWFVCVLYVCLR